MKHRFSVKAFIASQIIVLCIAALLHYFSGLGLLYSYLIGLAALLLTGLITLAEDTTDE